MEVIGVNSVEFFAGDIDELHRRRILRIGKQIDLEKLFGVIDGCFRAAVLEEATIEHKVAPGL